MHFKKRAAGAQRSATPAAGGAVRWEEVRPALGNIDERYHSAASRTET